MSCAMLSALLLRRLREPDTVVIVSSICGRIVIRTCLLYSTPSTGEREAANNDYDLHHALCQHTTHNNINNCKKIIFFESQFAVGMKSSHFILVLLSVLAVVVLRVMYYYAYRKPHNVINSPTNNIINIDTNILHYNSTNIELSTIHASSTIAAHTVAVETNAKEPQKIIQDMPPCTDDTWCAVGMPPTSLFKFDPPSDTYKWRVAQNQAASGEQVLLKRISRVFPTYLDFLDGDASFRKYNTPVDIFIDNNHDLTPLTQKLRTNRKLRVQKAYPWEAQGKKVIPPHYDFSEFKRAPVVKLGYFAFSTEGGSLYFEGPQVGEAGMDLKKFLQYWKAVKDQIQTPFIAIHSANENWGILSTYFPNRTITWGSCCDEEAKDLKEFLDHDKTLLFMVGQHSNYTHPKLVTFPRGLPLHQEGMKKIMWDTMRILVNEQPKNQLVFTASSKWGPRPQIIACVAKKFSESDFKGMSFGDGSKKRMGFKEYYRQLGSSRLGLALSGMGMDTFRLWEALTLGTVPVVEKGFGLDKSLWRLPALLVDDFDEVTPELLRTAYVEALYRADDFEFKRLTQSFWFGFLANVSVTMDTQTVLDNFPPHGEDIHFARPLVPFDCWKTNSCGAGTKRVPKSSC